MIDYKSVWFIMIYIYKIYRNFIVKSWNHTIAPNKVSLKREKHKAAWTVIKMKIPSNALNIWIIKNLAQSDHSAFKSCSNFVYTSGYDSDE